LRMEALLTSRLKLRSPERRFALHPLPPSALYGRSSLSLRPLTRVQASTRR
jgi:hypothetical protein